MLVAFFAAHKANITTSQQSKASFVVVHIGLVAPSYLVPWQTQELMTLMRNLKTKVKQNWQLFPSQVRNVSFEGNLAHICQLSPHVAVA